MLDNKEESKQSESCEKSATDNATANKVDATDNACEKTEEGVYTFFPEKEIVKYSVAKDDWVVPEDKRKKTLSSVIYVFLAAAFYAVGFHYFVDPCNFAPGGIGGVVAMVKFVMYGSTSGGGGGIDYSSLLFVLCNIPLFIPAYKILSKEFVVKTAAVAVIMAIIMFLLDNYIDPNKYFSIKYASELAGNEKIEMGTRLLSSLVGGAVCGLSLACALKTNASTGGADIVGAMIQKKNPHKSVASMIFAVNGVIFAISFFVYGNDTLPVFLSLIYTFTTTKTCDYIMYGTKNALKFEVITEHAEEISKDIIEKLGHGVTVTPAEGMFEHKNKVLLICVIKPRQTVQFQEIINRYPETFAYVGTVSEVIGKFNSEGRKEKKK